MILAGIGWLPALSGAQWGWLMLCGLLIGAAKGGIKGVGLVVVPLMAAAFGGKASTGIVLPMLLMADVFAVRHYHAHARWSYVIALLPAALLGIGVGMWIGRQADDRLFDIFLVGVVLFGLTLMVAQEWRPLPPRITESRPFSLFFGFLGGLSTMIGNAAGPVMAVYLLTTRLPKDAFIATGAWFYFIVNLVKLPLQHFIWHNITPDSLLMNLFSLPAIALGIWLGVRVVAWLPERGFRYFVIVMTFLISIKMLTGL